MNRLPFGAGESPTCQSNDFNSIDFMDDEQLFFDFFASDEPETAGSESHSEQADTFDCPAEEGGNGNASASILPDAAGENASVAIAAAATEIDTPIVPPWDAEQAETILASDLFSSPRDDAGLIENFPEEDEEENSISEPWFDEGEQHVEGLSLDEFFALPVADEKISEPPLKTFSAPETPAVPRSDRPDNSEKKSEVSPLILRQAVLGFLAKQLPTAVGLRVPTRFRKFQVSMAACWFEQQNKTAKVVKVVAVDICDRREHCFPACAERAALLKELIALKADRARMEQEIIANEPDLKAGDDLFEEFQTYDFSRSTNAEYHKLLHRIEKLHHAVYKGSRVESIRQARAADYLYIAVPAGELSREEVAEGWGLLYVYPDRSVEVVKLAELQDCDEEGRRRLALNVAASSFKNVLFANGVQLDEELNVSFNPPPRRRRKLL